MATIRVAELGDHAHLRHFSCHPPPFRPWTKRVQQIIRGSLCDALTNPERSVEAFVAVEVPRNIVGVTAIEPARDEPEVWAVHVLGVSEEFRGRGLGRQLFDTALTRCGEGGASSVVIEVHRSNAKAIRFFGHFNVTWGPLPDMEYQQGSIVLAKG